MTLDITALSDDLLRTIFSIVVTDFNTKKDLDYAVPVQFVLCTVCRRWRDLIHTTPLLWTNIHIPNTASYNTFSFFERSHPALIDVSFSTSSSWASSQMKLHAQLSQSIAKHISRLRSLKIRVLNSQEIVPIFQAWKDLECPNFEELSMTTDDWASHDPAFGIPVPDQFEDGHFDPLWTEGRSLRTLRLEHVPFSHCPPLPNLTTLEFNRLEGRKVFMQKLFDQCPELETLIIRDFRPSIPRMDDPTVHGPVACSSLKTLAVNVSLHSDPDCNCMLPSFFAPNLEHLDFAFSWSGVTNHTISILHHLGSFQKLKRLRTNSYTFWEHDATFVSSLAQIIRLEIINFPANQYDKLLAILSATNLHSFTLDLATPIAGRYLNLKGFHQFILDMRPTLRCPFLLCYREEEDERKVITDELAALLGNKFSVQSSPLPPWVLSKYHDSLAILDDEETILANLIGAGSPDFEEEDDFDELEEEFYDYEAALESELEYQNELYDDFDDEEENSVDQDYDRYDF